MENKRYKPNFNLSKGIKLKCTKCGWTWAYTGTGHYALCKSCGATNVVKVGV